jgi:hypothetical protein
MTAWPADGERLGQTNRWHSSSETLDHLRISSVRPMFQERPPPLCHVPGEAVSVRPREVNMVCEGLCESMHLAAPSVHIDIIRARVLEDTIHGSM